MFSLSDSGCCMFEQSTCVGFFVHQVHSVHRCVELIFTCTKGISKCIAGWWQEVQSFVCPWLAIAIKPRTEKMCLNVLYWQKLWNSLILYIGQGKKWLSLIAELRLVSCYLVNKTFSKTMDIIVNTFAKSAAVLIQHSRLSTESHQNAMLCCQSLEKVVMIHNTLLATPCFSQNNQFYFIVWHHIYVLGTWDSTSTVYSRFVSHLRLTYSSLKLSLFINWSKHVFLVLVP